MANLTQIPSAKNITEDWGDRCSDFEPECPCCQMWAMHDAIDALSSENAALKAERDRLREALKSARYYVEDAVIDDGGIDICEIQHRATLEKIDAALSTGQETDNG